jgi:hypothetical protein
MEFLTEQKRTVEDDLVHEIPFSRFLTMGELANPITLIEAPGPSEMIDVLSMTWVPLPTNDTAYTEASPGAFKTVYGDELSQSAAQAIGKTDIFDKGYYLNKILLSDGERPPKANTLNKPIKLFYDGELEDNGAEGVIRIIVSYRIIDVGTYVS